MANEKKVNPKKIEKSINKDFLEYVKDIHSAYGCGQYDPMITDISFLNYKNVSNDAKLEFNFPVSLIIGPNGTNKTSILRALESCPGRKSLSDYWFDTKLDPISMSESKKPEYFYSYSIPGNKNDITPQVRYRRALKRGREDRDYFETARPSPKLKMKRVKFSEIPADLAEYHNASRWKPVDKEVIYIDMRQRVSAYDINKSFGLEEYIFRRGKNRSRISATQQMKNRIRRTSNRMFDIFQTADSEISTDEIVKELNSLAVYYGVSKVECIPISLSEEEVKWVSHILGRTYTKITILHHSFFGLPGITVKVEVKNNDDAVNSTEYSEAYAGSGEYAVIMMVHQIYAANEKSLILMDEPENSLHPESQRRLMKYILHAASNKKIQFIISSHSQYMSENMPDESRIMLYLNENGTVEVESCVGHSRAFIGIGGVPQAVLGKIIIQTEDNLAARILREAIFRKSPRKMDQ
jgi:predicted ATP-dependent endonuclease of OLD family